MTKPIRCAIIGQNPMRFPWGFDEEDDRCQKLKIELAQQIMVLRQRGVSQFLTACDCGVGLYAAEILNGLRETTDQDLMLFCYTPHEEQATKWAPYLRERYFTIGQNRDSAVFQNFFSDPRRFVSGIHRYKLNFGKTVRYLVVYCVPCNTIAYISSGHLNTQHKAVLITGSMCFVRKLPLMSPFYKHSAVRVGFGHRFLNRSSSGTSLIFVIIVIVDFLAQFFSFLGHLFAKLFLVHLRAFGDLFLLELLFICGCLNMCSVNKNHAWVYHPVVQCFIQNMCKNFFTQLRGGSVCRRHNLPLQSEEFLPASYIRETNGMLCLLVYPGTSDVKTQFQTSAGSEPS